MKKFASLVVASAIAFSVNVAHAGLFGFFKSDPAPVVFTDLPDKCPKSQGWSPETNGKMSDRALCIIKKVLVNKKGQTSGVQGDHFWIRVKAEANGKTYAEIVHKPLKDFRGRKDDAKAELKEDIKKMILVLAIQAELDS